MAEYPNGTYEAAKILYGALLAFFKNGYKVENLDGDSNTAIEGNLDFFNKKINDILNKNTDHISWLGYMLYFNLKADIDNFVLDDMYLTILITPTDMIRVNPEKLKKLGRIYGFSLEPTQEPLRWIVHIP
jgi:hypothetical protein